MKPLVSIVIPVYNGSNYLKDAIDSALAQTYENIEVLVINDGSNDDGKTETIAKSYGDKIRYFAKENGGVSTALNLGIQNMKGYYFSWLSHDDRYHPNKVEVQINYLANEDNKNIVLYSDYEVVDENCQFKRYIKKEDHYHHRCQGMIDYLILNPFIYGCTTLIPKKALEDVGLINEKLLTTQDEELWFKLALTYEFRHIPEVLIQLREHSGQGSHTLKDFHNQEGDDLAMTMIESLSTDQIERDYFSSLHRFYFDTAITFYLRGYKKAGWLSAKRLFRYGLKGYFYFLIFSTIPIATGIPYRFWVKVRSSNFLRRSSTFRTVEAKIHGFIMKFLS